MQARSAALPLPLPAEGAISFGDQAQFHPVKYLHRLAQRFVEAGGLIFESSPIVELHEEKGCILKTASGSSLTANQVVLATHSPLNRVLVQTKLAHYQSYVVSGPAPAVPDGLYWDMEDPYHYIRSIDVDGARHLIVGGEDHKTGQESDTAAAFDRLSAWSSQVVEPVDALPFIGRNYRAENIDFPLHLVGDTLKPAEASSIDEVALGEGKLVRMGLSKVAVYKSPEGKVQCVSSICPHLGCHVAFNNAEKTWDCPCHGSRFTTDGAVIAGPALAPLAPHVP